VALAVSLIFFKSAGQITREIDPKADIISAVAQAAPALHSGIRDALACNNLKNGGTLEKAAAMANHTSTRTTQLYDRRRDEVSLDEVERIVI
jgi:hypothetical protein